MQAWLETMEYLLLVYWKSWALFAVYLAVTWLVATLARWLLRGLVSRLVARTNSTLDDRLVQAGTAPVRWTILGLGLQASLTALKGDIIAFSQGRYALQFAALERVVAALVILSVTAVVNALLRAALDWYLHDLADRSGGNWDRQLLPMVKRVASILVYFVGASIALETFGFSITALITTAGVASAAIALASQETLSNLLGGLVILVDRPFRVGDVIQLTDGQSGEVVEIGLRTTRIRQFDGHALVVPNKDMANTRVINLALPTPRAAIRQTIGVGYGTDLEMAKRLLLDVMTAHPEVLKDPAPGVWFTTFNAYSLDLFMSCWVASYRDRVRVADELNMRILAAFREHGIEIPYPKQDITVSGEITPALGRIGQGTGEQ